MSKIETIYLIHHSHTDVGYTHDQPIVWDLQTRFIDEALDLAERSADSDTDGAFRWTVETTSVLRRWLERAPRSDIDRFMALERAGRIEVTAMFANITPLFDTDQLIETFQALRILRQDYGFTIEHAMNCDVNGQNWPLVDLLLDLGIKGFTMAINSHFGGPFVPRPYPFYWEGPSGRTIATYNGWPYNKGLNIGIGGDADELENKWWPLLESYLEQIGYPLPILMLQSYHPYGDNGSAYGDFTPFIDAWNAEGKTPHIVMATPRMWWQAVEEHSHLLESYRGDWTDYWNFGSISSAREQAINRASRTRLRAADTLYATLRTLEADIPDTLIPDGQRWSTRAFESHRDEAWEALHLWDEHTWGADCSIRNPDHEDTASQWHHKAHYAYTARSLSLLLQRDALAEFAQHVERESHEDLLIFNPLPWTRHINGHVPAIMLNPRGLATDTTASRHHLDRPLWGAADSAEMVLPPTEVPAFGYTVVSRDALVDNSAATVVREDATVENHRYRVTFDRDAGGILSLYDKELDYEWVDQDSEYRFNGYVHEQVNDTSHPWPRQLLFHQEWNIEAAEIPRGWKTGWHATRSTPTRVIKHKVYHTALGYRVEQHLDAPGCVGPLVQTIYLPDRADYIECSAAWDMGLTVHPEATYLLFPFNLADAVARFDLGGQPVIPEDEQLPGTCRDYFTVQGWVDFSNANHGVTIALPDNPMIQLGDFHFGHNQSEFNLDSALLLGWVTNNYWETNFRAHQPGRVTARYRILPYRSPFDETRAHRFGLETANDQPLLQHLGERAITPATLPPSGTLLQLPEAPIMTLHVKPAATGSGLVIRLLNASDEEHQAEIRSGLLQITGARRCDLLESDLESLSVENDIVTLNIPARRTAVVCLDVERPV